MDRSLSLQEAPLDHLMEELQSRAHAIVVAAVIPSQVVNQTPGTVVTANGDYNMCSGLANLLNKWMLKKQYDNIMKKERDGDGFDLNDLTN